MRQSRLEAMASPRGLATTPGSLEELPGSAFPDAVDGERCLTRLRPNVHAEHRCCLVPGDHLISRHAHGDSGVLVDRRSGRESVTA